MKNKLLLTLFAFVSLKSFLYVFLKKLIIKRKKKSYLTIGFLQVGGALIGIDFEQLISERIGLSAGFGIVAYGASIHYHLKPSIKSSSVALNYWHQGLGDSYVQGVVGPTFVFRFKKLSFQLGFGTVLDKNEEYFYDNFSDEDNFKILFSVGVTL